MSRARDFDLILLGATGFTGRLVAEHLLGRHGADQGLKWALAGRSQRRLDEVRQRLGEAAGALELITVDSHDRSALDRLVARTRVVCTTVGPYALHGSELVAACAAAGTDYCDLSGEVPWMRRMLDAHEQAARRSGARIVHCCGFDSIPSDLGVWFIQQQAVQQIAMPLERVRMRVERMRGGLSGGTAASMLHIIEQARGDREIAGFLKNPYVLCPPGQRQGVRQPYSGGPAFDPVVSAWTAPFIMAAINTRVVHRSNALLEYAWGRDFRYDEAVLTGRGLKGRLRATSLALGMGGFAVAASFGPGRALLRRMVLPKPGEGPSAEQRENGLFKLLFQGRAANGRSLRARVSGDRDPGYGSTARMLGEAAVLLSRLGTDKPGGFWTPATALAPSLLDTLTAHAGLRFELDPAQ